MTLMQGKVPKAIIKQMIATGRYTVKTLDGTEITDWKALFEDANGMAGKGWPDGVGQPRKLVDDSLKLTDGAVKALEAELRARLPEDKLPEAKPPKPLAERGADGSSYTLRQLEHFGDAILALVSRQMVHAEVGIAQREYFHFTGRIITNANLGNGRDREIEIGRAYVLDGFDAAVNVAHAIVERTEAWQSLKRLLANG